MGEASTFDIHQEDKRLELRQETGDRGQGTRQSAGEGTRKKQGRTNEGKSQRRGAGMYSDMGMGSGHGHRPGHIFYTNSEQNKEIQRTAKYNGYDVQKRQHINSFFIQIQNNAWRFFFASPIGIHSGMTRIGRIKIRHSDIKMKRKSKNTEQLIGFNRLRLSVNKYKTDSDSDSD